MVGFNLIIFTITGSTPIDSKVLKVFDSKQFLNFTIRYYIKYDRPKLKISIIGREIFLVSDLLEI